MGSCQLRKCLLELVEPQVVVVAVAVAVVVVVMLVVVVVVVVVSREVFFPCDAVVRVR